MLLFYEVPSNFSFSSFKPVLKKSFLPQSYLLLDGWIELIGALHLSKVCIRICASPLFIRCRQFRRPLELEVNSWGDFFKPNVDYNVPRTLLRAVGGDVPACRLQLSLG